VRVRDKSAVVSDVRRIRRERAECACECALGGPSSLDGRTCEGVVPVPFLAIPKKEKGLPTVSVLPEEESRRGSSVGCL